MKINRLLILAALPMIGLTANAQEKGPQRNDFTVAATVSYDATVKEDAQPGNQMQYTLPTQSTNWNDKELRVGIEGGWFFLDEWKLVLGGGMSITKHPGYSAVPGTTVLFLTTTRCRNRTSCSSTSTRAWTATSRQRSTVSTSTRGHASATHTDATSPTRMTSTAWANQWERRSTFAER